MTAPAPAPAPATPHEAARRLFAAADAVSASLHGREDVVADLAVAAILGEHTVLLGPPGTAKSLLARRWAEALGGSFFEYLLTQFSEPNELFGPLDVEGFRQGTYRRVTTGMLPEAEVVFLDEAFKANSAILNSLLALLNERIYHDGGQVRRAPLRCAVLASNELPQGEALGALWDRCLVRHVVGYVDDEEHVRALLADDLPPAPQGAPYLAPGDLDVLRDATRTVTMPSAVLDTLLAVLGDLARSEPAVAVSDRRKRQLGQYLRAVAVQCGEGAVGLHHLPRLETVLWSRPQQREAVRRVLVKHASPHAAAAARLREAVAEAEAKRRAVEGGTDKSADRLVALSAAHGDLKRALAAHDASVTGHGPGYPDSERVRAEARAEITRLARAVGALLG